MMWRDLVLESGAGLSNAAKCRLRKSEWTLLAFADGSKLFVATRDLSPTIFHFKEKWKQLFDLGILGGATGRGRERGGDRWLRRKQVDFLACDQEKCRHSVSCVSARIFAKGTPRLSLKSTRLGEGPRDAAGGGVGGSLQLLARQE